MKKKIVIGIIGFVILTIAGGLYYNFRPEKRHWRHLEKARLYLKQGNLTSALKEYEISYNAIGKYTPYVSKEVLDINNQLYIKDGKPDKALDNYKKYIEGKPHDLSRKVDYAKLAFALSYPKIGFASIDEVLRKEPANFKARLLMAKTRLAIGQNKLAEEELAVLFRAYPDSLPVLIPLAKLKLMQGNLDESELHIKKALSLDAENVPALLIMTDIFILRGKLSLASKHLDKITHADSSLYQKVELQKAKLHTIKREFKLAKEKINPFLTQDKDGLMPMLALAKVLIIEGSPDSALKVINDIPNIDPNAKGRSLISSHLISLIDKQPAQALETLKQLRIGKAKDYLLPNLLMTYQSLGQKHKAIEAIELAADPSKKDRYMAMLDNFPSDRDVISLWGQIQYFKLEKENQLSLAAAKRLYQKCPKSPFCIEQTVELLVKMRRYRDASKLMLDLSKTNPVDSLALANLLFKARDTKGAAKIANAMMKRGQSIGNLNFILANNYLNNGKTALAMKAFKNELKNNPTHIISLNNLAWHYGVTEKNLSKAKPYMHKLDSLRANDPRILDTQGWIYAINGKLKDAEEKLTTAMTIWPSHPSILYHLAWVQKKLGKTDDAKMNVAKALDSKSNYPERKEANKLALELKN